MINWHRAGLGTDYDEAIGAKVGAPAWMVAHRRKKQGIKRYHPLNNCSVSELRRGHPPDLARKYGVCPNTVRKWQRKARDRARLELGVR